MQNTAFRMAFDNSFNLRKNCMQEHFYNVAYKVYENGIVKSHDSCLLRSSKVPTLDAAKDHIRLHFLKNPTAVITISHVTSLSQEVYKKLGGDPNAPLLKVDNW
jgi:hypothetical protein